MLVELLRLGYDVVSEAGRGTGVNRGTASCIYRALLRGRDLTVYLPLSSVTLAYQTVETRQLSENVVTAAIGARGKANRG